MDATVKVCRCVGYELGSSGCRRQHCTDPDSNKKIPSDSSAFVVGRTRASNLCSLTLSRKGRRGERRKRPEGFPLAASKKREKKSQPARSSSQVLRAKEDGSSCSSSSSGVASSVDINTTVASGPGRTIKWERRAARRNSRSSLCYSSPFGATEGGRSSHAHSAQKTNSSDSSGVSTASTGGDNGPQISCSTTSGHPNRRRPSASATSLPALNDNDGTCQTEESTRCSKNDGHPRGFTSSNGDGHDRGSYGQITPFLGGFPSTGVPDSPRSVSSAGSFETLTSAGDGSLRLDMDGNTCSLFIAEAETDNGKKGEANHGLGIVDMTLLDSWKRLPWQARLCPRAIEEREFFRQTSALEEEKLRVQIWRQKQQMLATSTAREEEATVSSWWKRAAKELWALQSGRREDYERLETRHAAELAALEKQRVELLSSGYGAELAALDRMDQSNLRKHLKQMESLASFIICDSSSKGGRTAAVPKAPRKTATSLGKITPGNAKSPPRTEDLLPSSSSLALPAPAAPAPPVAAARTNGWKIIGDVREDQQSRIADCVERISALTQSELEAVDLHTSAILAAVEKFRYRRQSFVSLLYRGLTEAYRDVRAVARRSMVSECAADIGRIKQTGFSSSSGDGSDGNQLQRSSSSLPVHPPPPAEGKAETSGDRIIRGISNKNGFITIGSNISNSSRSGGSCVVDSAAGKGIEAEPITGKGPEAAGCRERSRAIRELKSEAARVARWDKLQREVLRRSTAEVINLLQIDGLRLAPIGGGGSGGAGPIQATRKRARTCMRELKRRQADASSEATSIEQSWMVALRRWEAQLGKARATAVHGEIGEFWILQREDSEAVAVQENATASSLARRREVLATSWEGVYREERTRTGDTAAALRHCLLGASGKLQELVEESWRGRLETMEYWKEKMAKALSRSKRLGATMDRAQRLVDDAQAAFVEDLAKIVADNATGEIDAAAVARRGWWAEAGRYLGDLFLLEHGIEGSTAVADGDVSNNPLDRCCTSAAEEPASPAPGSAPMIEVRLETSLRKEEKRAEVVAADLVAGISCVGTKGGSGSSSDGGGGRGGGGGEGGGPLHLAAAKQRRRVLEAMEPCAKALEAARDCFLSSAVEQEARSEPENQAMKTHGTPSLATGESDRRSRGRDSGSSDSGSSDSGSRRDGRRRYRGSANPEEDPDSFRARLEADAILLAAASFETEVRGLAVGAVLSSGTGAAERVAPTALPAPTVGTEAGDSSPLTQLKDPPASCLTRSQLDLKRAARAGSFARALGEMLSRARAALLKDALQAAGTDKQRHERGVTMVLYRHARRVEDMRTRARGDGDEALHTALKRAESLFKEMSSDLRTVAEMRRRVVGCVVRWIDGAIRSHIQRSERRRRGRQERQHRRAASLRDFVCSISDEQQGLLCRVREEAREAIEAARQMVDGHVAELVRRRQEKEGVTASAAANVGLAQGRRPLSRDGSSGGGDKPALREGAGDNGQGDEARDGGEPRYVAFETEEHGPDSVVGGSCRTKNMNEGHDDGGDFRGAEGDPLRAADSQDNQDQGPHRPRTEEDDEEDCGGNETIVDVPAQREVLTAFAAAEASCLSRVLARVRDARHRARETAACWKEEAASGDRNERTTTSMEIETLASAFRAAKKEADEDTFGPHEGDTRPRPPGVAGGDGGADVRAGETAGSTSWVTLSGARAESGGQAKSVPYYELMAEEQKECSALWLSLERLLSSLQVDLHRRTRNKGIAEYSLRVEEEEEVDEANQSALRVIDVLESDSKREVAASFAGKIEDVRSMIRAAKKQLRSERCSLPRQQERGKQEAEATRLGATTASESGRPGRQRGGGAGVGSSRREGVTVEDAATADTADRPRRNNLDDR